MPDTPAPPSSYPLHSRDYLWERITFGTITDDDAEAMWKFVIEAARTAGGALVEDPGDSLTLADFKAAVLDINSRGDVGERLVLIMLVEGYVDNASARYESIVEQAGDAQWEKLWCKGALFAPTAPAIARDAWQRLLQLKSDFHYARCALGEVLERLGEISDAEAAYRIVVNQAVDEKNQQAWAVHNLGCIAQRRRDFDGAMHCFERSLQLNRELQDSTSIYLALLKLAEVAEARNEIVLTEAYLQQALQVAGEQADAPGVLGALEAISRMAERRGDFATAEDTVQRAIVLYEQLGDQRGAAGRHLRLGDLALLRDDAAASFTHTDRARAISQKSGDDAGTAHAFGALGGLSVRDKEYGDAEWYFRNSAALYEKVGDPRRSALMLENLGWICHIRGNTDASKEQLLQALALYERTGLHESAQKLREEMSKTGTG